MWTNLPFALFVLVKLDPDTINHVLEEAMDGASVPLLWLASENYDDAPKKQKDKPNLGQEPPISIDWKSPFIRCKVEEVAKWLQNKPETVDLDSNHFAVLDKKATEGSVIICKLGDKDLQGDSLSSVRREARMASVFLNGMEPFEWEEQWEGIQSQEKCVEVDCGE